MENWLELGLEENGFYGYFREGTSHVDKAMICMSGSDGKKELAIDVAEEIWNEGYSVLALGFHAWEGLPQERSLIPVDYMERAVKWLLAWENGQIQKVGVKGSSMGAQYALLCASLIPEISCVIVATPYDYVLECVDDKFRRTGKSTYSWRGEEVTYSPSVLLDNSVPGLIWKCAIDKHYGLKRMLRFYYDKNPLTEESRIRVENMNADVLLLAAENDDSWPSEIAARRVEDILNGCNYPHRVKAVIYEKGSHAIGCLLHNEKIRKTMTNMLPAEKKYPKECEEARQDSVRQIIDFLSEWE